MAVRGWEAKGRGDGQSGSVGDGPYGTKKPALGGRRGAPRHTPIHPPWPCSQGNGPAGGSSSAGQAACTGRDKDPLHTPGQGQEPFPPLALSAEPEGAKRGCRGDPWSSAVPTPTPCGTDPVTVRSSLVLCRPPASCLLTHVWEPGSQRAVVIHHLHSSWLTRGEALSATGDADPQAVPHLPTVPGPLQHRATASPAVQPKWRQSPRLLLHRNGCGGSIWTPHPHPRAPLDGCLAPHASWLAHGLPHVPH